jgi:hypothetical protein
VARIPDKAEHRRRFAALSFPERRAIVRAVNRGHVVDKRKHAPLAVVIARRQKRLWRWGWLAGPLIGLSQIGVGWNVALANGLLGTAVLMLIARFWYLRADRAEAANLAMADGRRKEAQALARRGGGWLPRRPGKGSAD